MNVLDIVAEAVAPVAKVARTVANHLRGARVRIVDVKEILPDLKEVYGERLLKDVVETGEKAIRVELEGMVFYVLPVGPGWTPPLPYGGEIDALPLDRWKRLFPGELEIKHSYLTPEGGDGTYLFEFGTYKDVNGMVPGLEKLYDLIRLARSAKASLHGLLDIFPGKNRPRMSVVSLGTKEERTIAVYAEDKSGQVHAHFVPSGEGGKLKLVLVEYKPWLNHDKMCTRPYDEIYYPLRVESVSDRTPEETIEDAKNLVSWITTSRRGIVKEWASAKPREAVLDGYKPRCLRFRINYYQFRLAITPLLPFAVNVSTLDARSFEEYTKLSESFNKALSRSGLVVEREHGFLFRVMNPSYDRPIKYDPAKRKAFLNDLKRIRDDMIKRVYKAVEETL